MTKKDLMTGDIIVNRGGYLGVVLKEEDKVLYQYIGSDSLSEFNDDLTFNDENYRDGDIMEVYRGISFLDVDNNEDAPDYQRDPDWHRPVKDEIEAKEKALEEERQQRLEEMRKITDGKNPDSIFIVAQQFYGNRTGTEISKKDINFFLKGILSPELFPGEDKTVDRKIVKIPGTDNLVIVYDQNQENEYVNVVFPAQYAKDGEEYKKRTGREMTMHVSCEIPEIGFKIHTRCFACRIDENGELKSLEDGDSEKYIRCFTD